MLLPPFSKPPPFVLSIGEFDDLIFSDHPDYRPPHPPSPLLKINIYLFIRIWTTQEPPPPPHPPSSD